MKSRKPISVKVPHLENHERFLKFIVPNKENDCWEWSGYTNKAGYGAFNIKTSEVNRPFPAHRVAWSIFNGDLDNTLVVDHLCRNKKCVNPEHLRQVTVKINVTENTSGPQFDNKHKEYCLRGHPFNQENTVFKKNKNGSSERVCLSCSRLTKRKNTAYVKINDMVTLRSENIALKNRLKNLEIYSSEIGQLKETIDELADRLRKSQEDNERLCKVLIELGFGNRIETE